ncbi:spore germination protein [Fodinisporobacter ferrooxydans]|uniref:Spore germination protein n=1 Tax=Fodinisporobacter ferrooxydans TaxID=2901836 RepID=A0ABY4CNU0_9BACL|nr:spore germination protein [Alicyclobacillaceae bacterium MYW30-H2]
MPAMIGAFKAISVSAGGVLQVGDTAAIVPKGTSKTCGGSGTFNTGDFILTQNILNTTNTIDMDASDQNIASGL